MRLLICAKAVIFSMLIMLHLPLFAEQGQATYQLCSACHGAQGEGNSALNAPVLAGQFDWYLQRQLQHFAADLRADDTRDVNGKMMVPFAKQLTDPEPTKQLLNYINSFEPVSFKGSLKGDLKNGSRYYQAKCGACHGGSAQGNSAFNAPKLAGQDPQYLFLQIANYQQGIRGTHQADKYGRQMAMMANTVSDKELQDIVFFITEQQ
ncbi:c-type cytochrome [Paraglaciecola sp.]|uniref:c-type cytochrome n=1 Tax=Paraglaciecola sp. TaxID=1920173 RepID=UPI0030F49C71